MTNLTVVVGGQYGSEAKGAVTAFLSRDFTEEDMVIRVAGPNAGHTVFGPKDGREWKLRQVPVGIVSSHASLGYIAAGSEIDLAVLRGEIDALDEAGYRCSERLVVSPHATIIESRHKIAETSLINTIGSTGKGIGAARASRLMRDASTVEGVVGGMGSPPFLVGAPGPFDMSGLNRVIIEGTQGYGLGLHHPNYPQVTSSDCRAVDFLAMAGISPWDDRLSSFKVVVVARCFPIRVAGNSGPLKGETTWAELGLPIERTTVTQNIRRVGTWDPDLMQDAITENGGGNWNGTVQIALTMLDQAFPETAGILSQTELPRISPTACAFIDSIEEAYETDITLVGTGPQSMFQMTHV